MAALVVLIALISGGCATSGQMITGHATTVAQGTTVASPTPEVPEATSLEIIVWRVVDSWPAGEQRPPDVKLFDQTFRDQGLVRTVQDQLNALERNVVGGCAAPTVDDTYEFRFATGGSATQEYTGQLACVDWEVVTAGKTAAPEPVDGALGAPGVDGENLMIWLHQQTGMPLPSWWPGG